VNSEESQPRVERLAGASRDGNASVSLESARGNPTVVVNASAAGTKAQTAKPYGQGTDKSVSNGEGVDDDEEEIPAAIASSWLGLRFGNLRRASKSGWRRYKTA
jgi:hypothetical protein